MLSTQQKQHSRLRVLDSLRGFAAVLVVIHHFMVFNEKKISGLISNEFYYFLQFLSSLNQLAVLFFFVLSGFSIGYSLKGRLLKNRVEANNYLYKRLRRILPIYILALIFSLIIGILINNEHAPTYSLYNFIGNILFLQTSINATSYWFSPYGQNGPLWSLAYEMFFYLFLPVLSYVILRFKIKSGIKICYLLHPSFLINIFYSSHFYLF
jgi:peptidoglycan/LPS O-acetylase OafA/YrhL